MFSPGDYPREHCIHQIFERLAAAHPDAIALHFKSETLTYGQLNRRANRLAAYLRQQGIGRDGPVGVCMDRCPELIVSLLAILKAGGAYLPLDPEYPRQRLKFMIRDAKPAVLLTQSHLASVIDAPCPTVYADQPDCLPEDLPDGDLPCVNTPEDLAYVIYTSGSTGTPKGTSVPHHGVVRLVFGQEYLEFGPSRVFLQLAPVGFDASTLEIWGPLLHGGRCVLYPGRVPELDLLGSLLAGQGVNTLWLTASLFNLIIDTRPEVLRPVETVLTGGEALSVPHVRKALERLPDTQLVNGYGPTESTTFTCCYRIPRPLPKETGSIPIGTPLAHTQVYLVDHNMQPVEDGLPGELLIGGDGLARGYLNREELTAERFIRNPFDYTGGSRLYRSGDICRRREDGTLEFQGRTDDQVKIRGFRIELGEIEHALRRCPGVRQAAAAARTDAEGQKYLAGYLVLEPQTHTTVDAVRKRLTEQLPGYMVPAFLVALERMPLTANGKTDRAALPDPRSLGTFSQTRTPPQTELEKTIAEVWMDLLGLESNICREDHFFELGGHSLKALQAVYRTQERCAVSLDVSDLFRHPTLAEFAARIEALRAQTRPPAPAISRVSRDRPVPLSSAQKRMWFIQQVAGIQPVYNEAWMIRMQGELNPEALNQSLEALVDRHESFRTTFRVRDGEPMQTIHVDMPWSLCVQKIECAPEAREEAFRLAAERQATIPIDLEAGPPFRCVLLDAGAGQRALLLVMHHLIMDGWSMGVLMEDLAALYRHFTLNEPVRLPPLPIQYADFSAWQREHLNVGPGEDFEYWKAKLADLAQVCTIPEDFPRPAAITYSGCRETYAPDGDLAARLQEVCRRHHCTLYSLLLCAYQVLLARLTGSEEVVVGSPIAGRTHEQTERVVGFFVNTVVHRTRIRPEATFSELLAKTHQDCIEAQRHQNLPYDQLVERLNPPRNPQYNPCFQTMLAYQDARYWTLNLPKLDCRTIEICTHTAKFDFILFAEQNTQGLLLQGEYNTNLYTPSTIQNVLREYAQLLETLAEQPDQSISAFIHRSEISFKKQKRIQPQINEPAGPAITSPPSAALPQGEVEKVLSKIWEELLLVDRPVRRDDNFFHLGGHSLKAVTLFYRIQQHFKITLPLGLIFETPTLQSLAAKIESTGIESITRDVVLIRPGQCEKAIFYLPGLGGHTLNFYHLAHALDIPLAQYGLNLPGQDGRRPLLDSIEAMAEFFIEKIIEIQPTGPYFLCGFSMGGTIAYEMALQLARSNQPVAFLALLGTPAPGLPKIGSNKPLHYLERLYRFFCRLSFSEKKRYLSYRMTKRKERLLKKLTSNEAQSAYFQSQILPLYETIRKISFKAFRSYQPSRPYPGPMILLREMGNSNPLLYDLYSEPVFGWDRYVNGPISVYDIECEHPHILHEPYVHQCAALMEKDILAAWEAILR